jgi:hypothetical protein
MGIGFFKKLPKILELLCLSATIFGNIGPFINHKCEGANLLDKFIRIDTYDPH